MTERRYRLDAGVRRYERVVVGGSPLTLFRLTDAGAHVVDRIAAGEPVGDSQLVDALLDAGAIHPDLDETSSTPYTTADVTVIVPTFGALRHAPTGAIVVDDGSTTPVPGATIRLDHNRGPGAARNAGLERVTTPLVAFVDADVALTDGWLDPLLPHFADDRVGLVAPRVTTPANGSVLARYEAGHSPLDLGDTVGRVHPGSRISYVPAAAIVARTSAVESIDGFDTSLRYGEDVDMVWRMIEAGWRVRYEPAAVVRHDPRPDWRSWAEQRIGYGSSAAPLAIRHPGALAPLRMSGWSVTAWVLAVTRRPLLGVAVGVGSAAALTRKLPDLPAREAFRLAIEGNARAGEQIARAVRRTWWPLLAVGALRSRIARRALLASAIAARHPIALADDVAYSVGVWRGMLADRTIDPVLPTITSWPGRSGGRRPPSGANRYRATP